MKHSGTRSLTPAAFLRPLARAEPLKVLITGGAGFVGGFLAKACVDRGHIVHVVDNLARGRLDGFLRGLLASSRVRLFRRDMLCSDVFDDMGDGYTHIFHLAAIVGVKHVVERPYETLRDNALLLDHAVTLARRQKKLERFVFTSTSEVYVGSAESVGMPIPTPEDTLIALPPLSRRRASYMLSKIYGEAMVHHAGLPFTVIRPHNVYGPRMGRSHVIPELLEKAYSAKVGGSIEVFSVDHRRTFCFIDDAVEMLLRVALLPSCQGQVLNVGTEEPELTIRELAELIATTVGKRIAVEEGPATVGSPVRRCPDMSRTAELTGYVARVSIEEGLRRTYRWYRQMVFEGGESEVAV